MGAQKIVIATNKVVAKKLMPWAHIIIQIWSWGDGDLAFKGFASEFDFMEWSRNKPNIRAMARYEACYG